MTIQMRTKATTALLLIGFAILVVIRMPHILLDGGRFWAEEGNYFYTAVVKPWYSSWFFVVSDAGYINFAAGFGTWLGLHIGGLSHAPLVTVLFALLIQCLPAYIAVTHEFPWRKSTVATIVVVILIAIPPVTGEVWLNTITSQFHLALATALIYAAAERRTALFRIDCAILAFAALSGPATSFLMPLFALDALIKRDRKSVVQAAILFAGFAIQLATFLLHPLPQRGGHLPVAQLLSVISLHTIFLQFAGLDAARSLARHLSARHLAHAALWIGPAIFVVFYAIVTAGIAWRRSLTLARLLIAGLVIVLVSFHEALPGSFSGFMQVISGQRYAFAPMAINALLIAGLAAGGAEKWRGLFVVATVVLLFVGGTNFYRGLAMFRNGPLWQPEVAAWRQDSQRTLKVWPGGAWAIGFPPSIACRVGL